MQTETEEKTGFKGGHAGKQYARPVIIETLSENKNIPHPELCMQCDGEYYIQPDGPDAGKLFACGIMVENIEAGNMSFACCYFNTTIPTTTTVVGDKLICKTDRHLCLCQPEEGNGTCGKIIDADKSSRDIVLSGAYHPKVMPL
jgi:hypothetical protein